jgi:hypothetical protein
VHNQRVTIDIHMLTIDDLDEALSEGSDRIDARVVTHKGKGGETLVFVKSAGKFKARKTRMYTLSMFRELFVPPNGLWDHYFSCSRCNWERRNPKLAVCPYCNIPMAEIGCVGQYKETRQGVDVIRLRSDLFRDIEQQVAEERRRKGLDRKEVRREGNVVVFRFRDDEIEMRKEDKSKEKTSGT